MLSGKKTLAYYNSSNGFSSDLSGNNVPLYFQFGKEIDENGNATSPCYLKYSDLGLGKNDKFLLEMKFMCTNASVAQFFFCPYLPVNGNTGFYSSFLIGTGKNDYVLLGSNITPIYFNLKSIENEWNILKVHRNLDEFNISINEIKKICHKEIYDPATYHPSMCFFNAGITPKNKPAIGKIESIKVIKE